jgi:nucleoid-associated protein YgaU
MIESRIPRARLILGALAAALLTACGDATEPPPGDSRTELERDLRQVTQDLGKSREALGAAERRIAALRDERARDRRRLAELKATSAGLERRNRELGQQLARNVRRVRELGNERQALRGNLAKAHGQIRRLQAQPSSGQREIADLRYRGAATARELEELRRYNAFLLQERGNLQAWLQEANATRKQQQDALQRSQQEANRIKSSADAANRRLRVELEKTNRSLAELETSRDALAKETRSLRAAATRAAEAERSRETLDQQRQQQADTIGDASALRAELEQATRKIAKLRVARDYLVEKIEACTLQQQSSRAEPIMERASYLALLGELVRSRNEAASRQQNQGRFMTAQWQPGAAIGVSRHARLIPVATHTDEQPRSTRREKELDQAKKKVKELELELEALTKELQELETEYATIKKQVQTLTWANEVLVKELEAAYQDREAGSPGLLPEGSRGIYVVQQGESLSGIAKAFYGDPGRWRDLVEANKDKIPDPDMLEPGTIILIPE